MEGETPTLNISNFGFYFAYSHLFQTIELKKILLLEYQLFLQSCIVLLSCIAPVSKFTTFPSPVDTCSEKSYITQFSEHVQLKNTSQLIKGNSRDHEKLPRCLMVQLS